MTERALRPGARRNVRDRFGPDEKKRREMMEASEDTTLSQSGSGPALHRVDPNRIAKNLSSGGDAAGYARLGLMVGTIFDRLVAGERRGLSRS
jgi:hypothetical protein